MVPSIINHLLTIFSPNLPKISNVPMVSSKARKWLDTNINKEMAVFEYGSGGSTLYIAKRCKKTVSVEHQYNWYLAVKKALHKNNLLNCDLNYCRPNKLNKTNCEYVVSDPLDKRYQNMSFKDYVTSINKYPDKYFDLVIIDGRARNSCLKLAKRKVKVYGHVFLDDADRKGYFPGIKFYKKYKKIDLDNALAWKIS